MCTIPNICKTLAALELFDTANWFMDVSIKHAFLHSSQFMKPAS